MHSTVSALILVVSTVILSAFIVGYATEVFTQTLINGNLQLEHLQELNQQLLNQTSNLYNPELFNQTQWLPQVYSCP